MVRWFTPHYVTDSAQLIAAIVCKHAGLAVTSACRQTFTSESYNITMRLQMYKYWHAAPTSPTTHPLHRQGRGDGPDVDPTDILTAAQISTLLRNLPLTPPDVSKPFTVQNKPLIKALLMSECSRGPTEARGESLLTCTGKNRYIHQRSNFAQSSICVNKQMG